MDRICVFCGSADSDAPAYEAAIGEFVDAICRRDIGLVYGGGRGGTMGSLADAVLAEGGEVVGVIPESILEREQPHQGLTELVTTASKPKRKAEMVERADGFVAFPGGIGTHEELFDVLGRAKHGFHAKPCGLLNVAGYYDGLVSHLNHAEDEGFLSPEQRALLCVASDADSLLDSFEAYESPITGA
jgi:hypothetical protein